MRNLLLRATFYLYDLFLVIAIEQKIILAKEKSNFFIEELFTAFEETQDKSQILCIRLRFEMAM
jgi:hypothetical protein